MQSDWNSFGGHVDLVSANMTFRDNIYTQSQLVKRYSIVYMKSIRLQLPDIQYPVLNARYLVSGFNCKIFLSGYNCQISGIRFQLPDNWYRVSIARYLVSGFSCQMSGNRTQLPDIQYPVSIARYLVSGFKFQNLVSSFNCQISDIRF